MIDQYLLILFVKLAVAASFASMLVRIAAFQRTLMIEERSLMQCLKLAGAFGLLFGAGVATRVASRNQYQAVDLAVEGSLLGGILGGYVTGLTAGVLISVPAMLSGELLSMPFFAGLGVVGGLLRDLAPDKEEIWQFSPFLDLSLYRLIRNQETWSQAMFQFAFLGTIIGAEFVRTNLSTVFGKQYLYALHPEPEAHPLLMSAATYATTLFAVTLPLKIWNNTRTERKLESQQALLTEARLRALSSQINPHFLFNTLNSVTALIRTNPDQARTMVVKLSSILRRLLKKNDSMMALGDELSFIGDYLAIEMVRFGDKLRVQQDVDPRTHEFLVPAMLLQPIVENSIKHGLASKVEGGTIRIQAQLTGGRLLLVVEDDGIGIPEERLERLFEKGIGVSNVNERLKVLYGDHFRFSVISKPGQGTRTEVELPKARPKLAAAS